MRYLLDTNIIIYMLTDEELLSREVKSILGDASNIFYMSVHSIRELNISMIKAYKKKYSFKVLLNLLKKLEEESNIKVLPYKEEHAITHVGMTIDDSFNHKDPFDHIIIAQSICERIPVITSDNKFKHYVPQGLKLIYNKK